MLALSLETIWHLTMCFSSLGDVSRGRGLRLGPSMKLMSKPSGTGGVACKKSQLGHWKAMPGRRSWVVSQLVPENGRLPAWIYMNIHDMTRKEHIKKYSPNSCPSVNTSVCSEGKLCNVSKAIENHPCVDGVYKPFMMILGMVDSVVLLTSLHILPRVIPSVKLRVCYWKLPVMEYF